MSDIKEVIAYYKAEQKRKASEHRIKHQHDGLCQPFTDKEFAQIQTNMKSSYGAKAKKHSYNGLWKHHDVKIETL
tara:strand:- start:203 stop:427 length:225 start_codon:yes stop_codon:yes gene_type:complete